MNEDYLDDNVVVPDYIKAMSLEEIEAEIKRLEAEEKEMQDFKTAAEKTRSPIEKRPRRIILK